MSDDTQPIRRTALLLTETKPGSEREWTEMVSLYNQLLKWFADHAPAPPPRKPIGGYVYFMQATGGGPIKIGWSIKPDERVQAHRIGAPVRLSLLAVMPGKRPDERTMHLRFDAAHVRGEWFRPVPELMALIESLKSPGPAGLQRADAPESSGHVHKKLSDLEPTAGVEPATC